MALQCMHIVRSVAATTKWGERKKNRTRHCRLSMLSTFQFDWIFRTRAIRKAALARKECHFCFNIYRHRKWISIFIFDNKIESIIQWFCWYKYPHLQSTIWLIFLELKSALFFRIVISYIFRRALLPVQLRWTYSSTSTRRTHTKWQQSLWT